MRNTWSASRGKWRCNQLTISVHVVSLSLFTTFNHFTLTKPTPPTTMPTSTQSTHAPSTTHSHHLTSAECISLEKAHSAHNYHPLPIVFSKASGAHVWDPEGNQYIDCLSAYSAVNQGHCHPKIVAALTEQASTLTLSSRAFYTNQLGPATKLLTETLGFEMALLMNTGAEAVETALKVARKWAYKVKGVEHDKARILSVADNFHGRTLVPLFFSYCRHEYRLPVH